MKKIKLLISIISFFSFTLSAQKSLWNASLITDDSSRNIPFLMEIDSINKTLSILNGKEIIQVENLKMSQDSLTFTMPVFGSQIKASVKENELARKIGQKVIIMDGIWYKYPNNTNYTMPFKAYEVDYENWNKPTQRQAADMSGKWSVVFTEEDGNSYTAIGEFEQDGNIIKGTFLTNTGDYRFLSGKIFDQKFFLSCFDGAHAFLFTGMVIGDKLTADFYSGKKYHEKLEGKKDPNAKLSDPYSLTCLKEGYKKFDFSLPSFTENTSLDLSDERFKNKAVVIQIMGTWCPNCMDETALYAQIAPEYQSKDVEFVAIAFERYPELEKNRAAVEKFKNHFNISYPILFGGIADKKVASEQFPMLNEIMSFPTTIVLDKKHKITKIHTGFYGPATSEYDKFVDDFILLLDKISN